MDFFDSLAARRDRHDVLRHPFYERWTAGELTREELALYAGQYRHAVQALARQSAAAADAADQACAGELAEHAREEAEHVELWDRFAAAVGCDGGAEPLPETARCAEAWTAGGSLVERLAVMYAIESAQPAISQTKLEGLAAHYGIPAGHEGGAYFELHSRLDHEHAESARRLISERASGADAPRMTELALAALAANWELLDGVERACGRTPAAAA